MNLVEMTSCIISSRNQFDQAMVRTQDHWIICHSVLTSRSPRPLPVYARSQTAKTRIKLYIFILTSWKQHTKLGGLRFILLDCITNGCEISLIAVILKTSRILLVYIGHPLKKGLHPFPNKSCFLYFLRVCRTSVLKILREREILLVATNFSFSHGVS